MAISLRSLYLLLLLIAIVCASPTTEDLSFQHSLAQDRTSSYHTTNKPSHFRKFRDAIIEKIFSLPQKSKSHTGCTGKIPTAPTNFRTRYGNDVVLRFTFESEEEVKALSEASNILYLDVWEFTDEWVDIRIAKDVVPSFLSLLPDSLHNSYSPVMHDLAQAVYDTYPISSTSENSPSAYGITPFHKISKSSYLPHDRFFQEYQPLSVIYPWLRLLASMFPTHVELSSIGQSAEGRDIPILRVGARTDHAPDDNHPEQHTILITAGSHAREWISVSTAAYVAYSLVTKYGDPHFPHVTKLLDHFDFLFVPVLNPDGYEYTWSTDRLWRKNRQTTPIPFCHGIEIDRAFPFGWDGNHSTDNACSEDYAGSNPLEAIEAKLLTEYVNNEADKNNVSFAAFLDLHSYSQRILYPYSFSCNVDPPNLEDLEEVALGLAKSFRLTNGHYFGVSSACEGSISLDSKGTKAKKKDQKFKSTFLDSLGGSALDYFYHDMRVKYAYQIKLRDTGSYGFLLPKSNIVPSGYEAYEAVLGLGKWLLGNHGIEGINNEFTSWSKDTKTDNVMNHLPADIQVPDTEIDNEEDVEFELRRRRRR